MNLDKNKRRHFLIAGLGASAGILTTSFVNKSHPENAGCDTTPEQDLGPFYPHVKTGDGDLDLTTIVGKSGVASGEIILVRGRVVDNNCNPVAGALVEIWQANTHGRYSHEGDANNKNPLDAFFEGWGEMQTNEIGEYGFKTIKPASYQIGRDAEDPEDWRTPHIHFRVSRRGYHEIVTQMYFPGEKLNDSDIVLAELPTEDRGQFIITPQADASGHPLFNFVITLDVVKTKQQRADAWTAYCGKYEVDDWISFTVHQKDGQLYLDIPEYTAVELKPGGKDEFTARPIYLRLVFNKNSEGNVVGCVAYDTSIANPSEPRVGKRV